MLLGCQNLAGSTPRLLPPPLAHRELHERRGEAVRCATAFCNARFLARFARYAAFCIARFLARFARYATFL